MSDLTTAARGARRKLRLARRRERLDAAPTPTARLHASYDMLRAEIGRVERTDKEKADQLRMQMSDLLANAATRIGNARKTGS